ncbi:MAG: VWA domain-containing protein, partial [Treponema sp.]|nr:VWA domain-containing protein [Treponema sp.]
DAGNFLITEGKVPVTDMKVLGAANNNDIADVTILIDRSFEMEEYEEQVNTAVRELAAAMNGHGKITVISVGDIPVTEYSGSPDNLNTFSTKALKSTYTDAAALDLGIRLAANGLVNAEKKRGIVFLTAGTVSQNAFMKYGLSDLSAYLNNNAISFSTVLVSQTFVDQEIEYITENTTGGTYYVYRAEGLAPVINDLIGLPSGLYQITFTSNYLDQTQYGRRYLPIEVETYLLNRSGKDESGYFAPLQ